MSQALRSPLRPNRFRGSRGQKLSLTADERNYVEDLLTRAQDAKGIEVKMAEIGKQLGPRQESFIQPGSFNTDTGPGDIFIRSNGYKAIQHPDGRPRQWTSGMVEVSTGGPALEMKGTLLESTAGGPGRRGGTAVLPARRRVEAVRAARCVRPVRLVADAPR